MHVLLTFKVVSVVGLLLGNISFKITQPNSKEDVAKFTLEISYRKELKHNHLILCHSIKKYIISEIYFQKFYM